MSCVLNGKSSLLNGASCLLIVGRFVLGRVFFEASYLGVSCLWCELSKICTKLGPGLTQSPVNFSGLTKHAYFFLL